MRTIIVIALGIAIGLGLPYALRLARLDLPALWVFIGVWALFCIGDVWYGVAKAGYALDEEAMIHMAVFLIPVIAVWVAQRLLIH